MNYSDILRYIKTVDQAEKLSYEIDILLKSLFETRDGLEDALNSISAVNSERLKETFLKNNINLDNLAMTREYLIVLKEELQKQKTLKLSLAFPPSEDIIDNLFDWVLNNLGEGIILDIDEKKNNLRRSNYRI